MTVLRDIKLAQEEQLNTRAPNTIGFPAIIVKVEDSVHPPNRPNYVWVLEQGKKANVLQVLNIKVAAVEGLSCWIRESPLPGGELEVWGLFLDHLDLNMGGAGSFSLPLHSQNHEFRDETEPPIDPVGIYLPALRLLKTVSNLTMTVNVLEHTYTYENNVYNFAGEALDLTSYVPTTAGRKIALLIALDIVSNLIVITSGVETLTIIPTDFPEMQQKTIPSAYVILTAGQTYINSQDGDVLDCRNFLGLTTNQLPSPEQAGDILISHNGIEWTRGEPVVDSYGEIVTSNGVIVTT